MAAKVYLARSGNRILARSERDFADNGAMKSLEGSWNKRSEAWSFPLTMDMCHRLRAQFGDRIEIMPSLRQWAWETRKRHESLEQIRAGIVPSNTIQRLPEATPALWDALQSRRYQVDGVAFAVHARRSLNGDQPGLGKTFQGMGAIVESGARRVLVSCPRTAARGVWDKSIKKWMGDYAVAYLAQGTKQQRQTAIELFNLGCETMTDVPCHVLIINKEMIRTKRREFCPDGVERPKCKADHHHEKEFEPQWPELFETPFDMIVMDEAHHALASTKNRQSKNITQIRLGAIRLPVADDGFLLAMSGTPYRSKAQKAWGTLNWCRPKEFSSYWKWAGQHFEVTQGRYAMEVSKYPLDETKFRDSMRPYVLARTKQEVAKDLPPIEYAGDSLYDGGPKAVWLDMEPPQDRAYRQMEKIASAQIKGGQLNAVGVLAELTRLKQFACSFAEFETIGGRRPEDAMIQRTRPALPSNKFDWCVDFLREREGFDGKVIIASQFTSLLKLFQLELHKAGFGLPLMLTGETTDRGREDFQNRIQNPDDPNWIGLINMRAGGEAITLDQADDMVLLDLPWTDDEIRQVEDRIHRISRIHQVTIYRLQSYGTVDQMIGEMTDEQRVALSGLRPTAMAAVNDYMSRGTK